jgi:hypothetical protein
MKTTTENPAPSGDDDIRRVLQDELIERVLVLKRTTRSASIRLPIPNTDIFILAGTPEDLRKVAPDVLAAPAAQAPSQVPAELTKDMKPSFFVIVDASGFPEFVTSAKHAAQEHINDACTDGVEGAGKWKAVPVFEMRPTDDHLWDQTLRDRDTYHDWADKLAEAIAKHFDAEIGEHSNMNCPWAEALEVIESEVRLSAVREARNEALEEAAKACDNVCKEYQGHARRRGVDDDEFYDAYMNKSLASSECASAIRALKDASPAASKEGGA